LEKRLSGPQSESGNGARYIILPLLGISLLIKATYYVTFLSIQMVSI
jgi:hypothetical protein